MKILIFGGTRHHGRLIVEKLLGEGHDITVFSRGNTVPVFIKDVEFLWGDRHDKDTVKKHLAGRTFDAVIDNIAYTKVDVENLFEVINGNIGHYIFCSSGAVFTHKEFNVVYDDYDVDYSLPEEPTYSSQKRAIEKLLLYPTKGKEPDFPSTILRPTGVEGPNNPYERDNIWFWGRRILDGGPVIVPYDISHPVIWQFVYEADLVNAFISCLNNKDSHNSAFNIVGEEFFTPLELFELQKKILGKETSPVLVADAKIREYKGLEEYIISSNLWVQSVQRAKLKLGYRPTPLEKWVKITLEARLKEIKYKNPTGYTKRNLELEAAEYFGRYR